MPQPLPSIAHLRRLLSYDPETGILTWLPRPPEMFFSWNAEGKRKLSEAFNKRYAGQPALIGIDGFGYYQGTIQSRYFKAHRVAWALHYGEWPTKKCSHRNGDHRDNRISNLRDVDHQTCHRNCKLSARNTTGAAGVTWHRRLQRWQAFVRVDRKSKCIGTFVTFEEAAAARQAAAIERGFDANHGKPRDFVNKFIPTKDRVPLQTHE